MVITSKRHPIQDEEEIKCCFINNPILRRAVFQRWDEVSQFRKITRQINEILQNLTHDHTICLGSVEHLPQRHVTSRNITEIKSIERILTL